MFCIIKTIFAWIILLVIGQTLIGLVIRGFFWSPPSANASTNCVRKILTQESRKLYTINIVMTFFSLVLTVAFFFAIYYFWNAGLAVSAGLLLLSRLPDLLWKIRTGNKVSKNNMPKGAVYIMSLLLTLISLPLIWYYLCK